MALMESKLSQKWLALGLLVLVVLVFSLVVVMPIINKGLELNESKQALAFRLQQYERVLATQAQVAANVEQIKQAYAEQGYLNSQQTSALASAELQEFIKKTIVEAGGQLSSTQVLPVSTKGEFTRITISVRMTGSSEVLRTVLYNIETTAPLIVIDQIDIRPMRGVRNRTTRQLELSNELNVNFQAVSFMRKQSE
ncbi:MAG: type II secretion system protein GspM [Methylococcaceae bacterium]|jgi:general secretion pathway protein M|nr:type II secretion system protein GspM [Methylococcaceae bacterium]MDZ4156589.1 type II secretion system protein GspM [Methylococcales bacterium]MDP2394739.1 type II secretion system protein GspM [Methylococcaceae bacterium]MDP3020161.1 type II secretion system protein GspM [Methylococcaceae bacterium]MDP3390701.1 type II secretion system protein GspM [Methylococcaceae bacterium]